MLEIEKKFDYIKILRQKIDVIKMNSNANEKLNANIEKMMGLFQNVDVSFSEYDDITIRRLVECIRVMKNRKIVVILKGGMSAEDNF